MPTAYSFNVNVGEIQTSTATFPIRLTFGSTTITPLVTDFVISQDGAFNSKIYLQGGPGKSIYSPAHRKIHGSFKLPIRIDESKEIDPIISSFIDYTFFNQGSSCTPLAVKYFELETGFFKTAQGFFVPPGKAEFDYNNEFIQIKINRCIITNLKISSSSDSEMSMSIEFSGTVAKSVSEILFTQESQITSVKESFDNYRIMALHDCKTIINGSYLPNCTSVEFEINRELVEKVLSRSFNVEYSSVVPGLAFTDPVLNYSNDLPSKIGVKSFEAKITLKQILRKIDEDLYFSRGGKASVFSSFASEFIDVYFGPIKISRTCALAQQSEQPFAIGAIERSTTFLLLNKPKVIEEDFISIITGGLW